MNFTAAPSAAPARLRLRLTAAAESAVRSGHPWVYSDSIRESNRAGRTGEFAIIYDRLDRFLAIGWFDPDSPLRVRILHTGKPCHLDAAWWRERLATALTRRHHLFGPDTTGYRLIHGESDGWPGLVLDRYDTTLVVKLYTSVWLPTLADTLALIREAVPHERVVLRLSRNIQDKARAEFQLSDGQVLHGDASTGPVIFSEHGLWFEADVLRGQKTGFFLDQRENRQEVGRLAEGRRVLNAFSFSGGFSLYAARGGARAVTDVDISTHALDSARRNFALNQSLPAVAACRHEMVQADAFDWLAAERSQFDLIVLDPPALAKRAAERASALHAYERLSRLGLERLARGGILVAASCSAQVPAADFFATIRKAALKSGRTFTESKTLQHPPDHPAGFKEAEYLKVIYLRFTE